MPPPSPLDASHRTRLSPPDVHRADFSELDPVTAYRILALREQVFVVEQDCVYADLDGRDVEPTTVHLWVEVEGAPVSYLRVLDEGDHARIGRVVTQRTHRGRGLGAALLRAALEVIGERRIELHAQAHLRGWYERFGFEVSGEEFLEDGILHLPMQHP